MSASPAIETERLRLDPLSLADAAAMASALSDPRLYQFIGGGPPMASALRELYGRWFEGPSRAGEAWHNWAVRLLAGDTLIGHVQATVTDEGANADVAWTIGVDWQGRGYATEAARAVVDWLTAEGATGVTAHVHPNNHASIKVAERIGLERAELDEGGELVWRRPAHAADNGPDA